MADRARIDARSDGLKPVCDLTTRLISFRGRTLHLTAHRYDVLAPLCEVFPESMDHTLWLRKAYGRNPPVDATQHKLRDTLKRVDLGISIRHGRIRLFVRSEQEPRDPKIEEVIRRLSRGQSYTFAGNAVGMTRGQVAHIKRQHRRVIEHAAELFHRRQRTEAGSQPPPAPQPPR